MFKKKPARSRVFGVPLLEAAQSNRSASQGSIVADIVVDVITYLEKHGECPVFAGALFFSLLSSCST